MGSPAPSLPCFRCLTLPRAQGSTYCGPCQRDLLEESRLRDPRSQAVLEAKCHPCVDCGQSFPFYLMDLDHVRGVKSFELGLSSIRFHSLEAVLAEIQKCEPRCVICHRHRHHAALRDPNDPRDRDAIAAWTLTRDQRRARR